MGEPALCGAHRWRVAEVPVGVPLRVGAPARTSSRRSFSAVSEGCRSGESSPRESSDQTRRELARDRNDGYLAAAPAADALVERAQGAWPPTADQAASTSAQRAAVEPAGDPSALAAEPPDRNTRWSSPR